MSSADCDEADIFNGCDELKPPILEIRCGHLTAKLHLEKFVCPGIHQQCIEIEGELISPKEFTIRANKDRQKDWKGSIRIGKSNMRALMEMKSLDFYNHENYCSAKCQSRNFMACKHNLDLILKPDLFYSAVNRCKMDNDDTDSVGGVASGSNQHSVFSQASLTNVVANLMLKNQLDEIDASNLSVAEKAVDGVIMSKIMQTHPVKFWAVMSEMGLMGDLVEMISNSLQQTSRYALMGAAHRDSVAERLTQIVTAFNLEQNVAARIRAERLNCSIETNLFSTEIQDLQKKAEENWRKLEETKRKAAQLDELLTESSPSSAKRPRSQTVGDNISLPNVP